MGRFYWNEQLIKRLKEIYFLYTNKEISENFEEFKGLTATQIMKKGNEDLKLKKSEFILKNQNNINLPVDFNKRLEIYNNYINIKDGYQMCFDCFKVLKNNTDYFFMKNGKTISRCKECKGHNFTKKLEAKEGYKFCIKCDRELPNDFKYFSPDDVCTDGLRNVCRECSGGHFMKDEYVLREIWTDGENQLFKERYPNYTSEELINQFYQNETMKTLSERAYRLGCSFKTDNTKERTRLIVGRKLSGANCSFWNGGVTDLNRFLRYNCKKWKTDTMKKSHYKCCITGLKFDIIHHLYNFQLIRNEVLECLKLEEKNTIYDYNQEELQKLINTNEEFHYKHGLGVCLSNKIHTLYHEIYGRKNNNESEFKNFQKRYYNGEFDDKLDEELKSYNSIKRLKELNLWDKNYLKEVS